MTISQALQDLVGEGLWSERAYLDLLDVEGSVTILLSLFLHVFLDVVFAVFKNEVKLLILVNHLFEFDDVGMLEALQQGDFSDGGARHTIIFLFKPNFLESYNL